MSYLKEQNRHSKTDANAIGQNQREIPDYNPINQPKKQAQGKYGIHQKRNIFGFFGIFQVLITWGNNEEVVHMAAITPIKVVQSNFILQPSLVLE